jgi:hypothetical protein
VSVTAYPAEVAIVMLLPEVGTVPANVTVPVTGARIGAPAAPEMSMPRCWPPAYGWAGSKSKAWRTDPDAGHVQAPALGTTTSTENTARSRRRRIGTTLVV